MVNNCINTTNPLVQMVYALNPAVLTSNAAIPGDDTAPTSAEGTEIITATITPKSATNLLVISFTTWMSATTPNTGQTVAALFQDAGATAIAASCSSYIPVDSTGSCCLTHVVAAGTINATTFKVRVGPLATANTFVWNGYNGGRYFSGASATTLTIMEIKT